MIFPGEVIVPKLDSLGVFQPIEENLFPGELKRGIPRPFEFEDWIAEKVKKESSFPGAPSPDDIRGASRGMAAAFAKNQQDVFGLALQNAGLVGNGSIADGIGGLAATMSRKDVLGEDLQRSFEGLGKFGTGLGSARVALTKYFPQDAADLGIQLIGAVMEGGQLQMTPSELQKAVINTTLGTVSSILMMTPSPFGVTQIVASVLTAAQALVDAFYPGNKEVKISRIRDIKPDLDTDVDHTNRIKGFLAGAEGRPLAAARGNAVLGVDGMNLDFHKIFDPPYKKWPTNPGKNEWPGYAQASDGNRNVSVIFSAGRLNPNAPAEATDSMGFVPGGLRRHICFRASYHGIKDNSSRGKATRSDKQIKSLGQLRCKSKDDKKHDHCVPFRNLNVPESGPLMGSMLTRPITNDVGAWLPSSSQACAQIWSTMVNRVGPMMYAVDAMELASNWCDYFESFRECMERLWHDKKGVGWRATILKVCSLMMCEWDTVSCSWVMRDSYTPGYPGNTISAQWVHDPRDDKLKIDWNKSIYELIIRPACINLAKRQYEYLHTSAVAYLPEKARAYEKNGLMRRKFHEMRNMLADSSMKQYLSMDDVIDVGYRDRLGPSAGTKTTETTPVLFGLVEGLTIPAPKLLQGGVPQSTDISYLAQSVSIKSMRHYGSSGEAYQRHMSILEECKGKGPEGQSMRALCESAMMFDYMLR